jgi:hypothetical protein
MAARGCGGGAGCPISPRERKENSRTQTVGLTYLPALSLGPLVEHFVMGAGTLY